MLKLFLWTLLSVQTYRLYIILCILISNEAMFQFANIRIHILLIVRPKTIANKIITDDKVIKED